MDQNSSDTSTTMKKIDTKCDSSSFYVSNSGKYYHDVQQQDDSSGSYFFSYLDDFDLSIEKGESLTEPQMQNNCIYYKQDNQEGELAKQSRNLHKDTKMDSSSASSSIVNTGIAPSYEYSWSRKKRKKNKSDPGTHLSSTLNFPYKETFEEIESNASSNAYQRGIWKGEGDNAEVLEKHFNSTWQFNFMKSFYCGMDSSQVTSTMRRSQTERIEEQGDTCCDEDMKRRGKETNDFKDSESLGTNKPPLISLVKEERVSIDDALWMTNKKLLEAMDSTDLSRDQVLRLEDEIGINRTTFLKDKFRSNSKCISTIS